MGNRFTKTSIRLRFSLHRITQTGNPPDSQPRLFMDISTCVKLLLTACILGKHARGALGPLPLTFFLLSSQAKCPLYDMIRRLSIIFTLTDTITQRSSSPNLAPRWSMDAGSSWQETWK